MAGAAHASGEQDASSQQQASSQHVASSQVQASQPTSNNQQSIVPRGTKRIALESNSDRAEKKRKMVQPGRVLLGECGANPNNRGGKAVIPYHVHISVLTDIITNGTSPNRYAPVRLVEVPEHMLEAWRAANREMCGNPLMPAFSKEMKYMLLTKHHFVYAQKIIEEGCRRVFNKGMHPARLWEEDSEGRHIQEYGFQAIIYDESLFDSPAAMQGVGRAI